MHDNDIITADNVLIAVGFYIGEKKKYDGALPFVIVAALTVFAMVFSEVILNIVSFFIVFILQDSHKIFTSMIVIEFHLTQVVAFVRGRRSQHHNQNSQNGNSPNMVTTSLIFITAKPSKMVNRASLQILSSIHTYPNPNCPQKRTTTKVR